MSDGSPQIIKKPLPSLREWIGDGARADGFEDWVRASLLCEDMASSPEEARLIRLVQIFSIASVEGARIEADQHGATTSDVVRYLARSAGVSVMSAVLCVADDNPGSLLKLVKIIGEDFLLGARQVALSAGRKDRQG